MKLAAVTGGEDGFGGDRQASVGRECLAALCLAIIQMAAAFWLFYPGLLTYDSVLQYHEAISGRFTTVHPPLMAAVWRLLLHVHGGALPMFVMNEVLYWSSFAVLAVYCLRTSRRRISLIAGVAGMWPLLLSFSGVIWKDVTLAAAWGLSCALLLLAAQGRDRPVRFWIWWIGAALLLIFGAAMRHNAFPAAIVLAAALTLAAPLRRTVQIPLLLVLATTLTLAVPVSGRLLHAQDSRPIINVISWDLTGISYFSGHDYRPDLHLGSAASLRCYSPRLFDNCPLAQFSSTADAIGRWRSAIEHEPLAYLKHRALVFSMLLRFGCRKCRPYIAETGMSELPPGLEYRPNFVRRLFAYFLIGVGLTPVGRPYVWLTAAIGLSALLWTRRQTPEWLTLCLICVSGIVYTLTYLPAAVTDEFRYVYWQIYSVVLVGTVYLFATRVVRRDLLRWIIVPVLCMIVLDVAVEIALPTDHIAPSSATNY